MTESKVVDIIRLVMSRLRQGDTLNSINLDIKDKYDISDVNAAYSWLVSKYPEVTNDGFEMPKFPVPQRLLHFAERMIIGKEEYGFLLELVSNDIISVLDMEQIIERVMLGKSPQLDMDMLKSHVAKVLLKKDSRPKSFRSMKIKKDRLH